MGRVTKAVAHLQVEGIDERIKPCTAPWHIRRWQVIRCALVNPKPAAEIALEVGLARQTVHNLVAAYNRHGPSALETPGRGQRQHAYLSLEQERAVVEHFLKQSEVGQVSTGLQIKAALETVVGHQVAKTTVYRVLRRPQWRQVVPRPRHPQASAAEQKAFKKLPPAGRGSPPRARPTGHAPGYDHGPGEGRFGRIDYPRRCWAPKPIRPTVPCQVVREFVYVFAAVGAQWGRLTALILPTANTEMMSLFLAHVAQEFSDFFIVMLVDRAGWHTAKRLIVPENIRLLPQPARSPELNPTEHIWEDCGRRPCPTGLSLPLMLWRTRSAQASPNSLLIPTASVP